MNGRYRLYYAVIALLVLANLGRWAWHGLSTGPAAREGLAFEPGDFQLRSSSPAAQAPLRRDVFQADSANRAVAASARPLGQPAVQVPPPVPPVAPADDRIGRLRLLGVVMREGRAQAYLALDKSSAMAYVGDTVFERFVVSRIDVDAVELRSMDGGILRKIPISGK